MIENSVVVNIFYLTIIIILPLLPAWVLYKMIPTRRGDRADVQGTLFGLDIKFGGAFAGYLILVLISWNFLSNRNDSPATGADISQFEYFTINGRVDVDTFNNYSQTYKSQDVLLSPPESVFYSNGTFTIKHVPIDIKSKTSRLIITDGSGLDRKESIIYINDGDAPEFLGASVHDMTFESNNQINISTLIKLFSLADQGGFQ